MIGCGCRRRRGRGHGHGQAKSNLKVVAEVALPSLPTQMSIESAENATARPELVGVSPSASLKGSGAGKQRASDAKARRARHVGSMSLDEKLRLLEEVAAALKDQGTNGRYLSVSGHGSSTGPYSSRSGAPIHSSVPPSTPEGGSDPSDIEMGDSDEIDDLMEMTASTEVYDSDTDVVPPAAGLRRVSICF